MNSYRRVSISSPGRRISFRKPSSKLRISPTGRKQWTRYLGPNSAPGLLTFTDVTSSGVRINWTNNANNLSHIEIFRDVNPNKPPVPVVVSHHPIASYLDSNLLSGVVYHYWIDFVNANGIKSSTGNITTQAVTWNDTGLTLNDTLSASPSDQWITAVNGSFPGSPAVGVGDMIKIDNEQMLVTALHTAGRIRATRAQNGTTLSAHHLLRVIYVDHA